MNHLDQDESSSWNDDIGAFEQQLRAIRPTEPTRPWSAVEESLERPVVVSREPVATSLWRPIISHAATAAIGLAVGIAVMLMQQPSVPATTGVAEISGDSDGSIEIADQEHSSEDRSLAADSDSVQPTYPTWRSRRFSDANLSSGSLRAFGAIDDRLASSRDLQERRQRLSPVEDVNSRPDVQTDERPIDRPVLSPRSLDLFLNDVTQSYPVEGSQS